MLFNPSLLIRRVASHESTPGAGSLPSLIRRWTTCRQDSPVDALSSPRLLNLNIGSINEINCRRRDLPPGACAPPYSFCDVAVAKGRYSPALSSLPLPSSGNRGYTSSARLDSPRRLRFSFFPSPSGGVSAQGDSPPLASLPSPSGVSPGGLPGAGSIPSPSGVSPGDSPARWLSSLSFGVCRQGTPALALLPLLRACRQGTPRALCSPPSLLRACRQGTPRRWLSSLSFGTSVPEAWSPRGIPGAGSLSLSFGACIAQGTLSFGVAALLPLLRRVARGLPALALPSPSGRVARDSPALALFPLLRACRQGDSPALALFPLLRACRQGTPRRWLSSLSFRRVARGLPGAGSLPSPSGVSPGDSPALALFPLLQACRQGTPGAGFSSLSFRRVARGFPVGFRFQGRRWELGKPRRRASWMRGLGLRRVYRMTGARWLSPFTSSSLPPLTTPTIRPPLPLPPTPHHYPSMPPITLYSPPSLLSIAPIPPLHCIPSPPPSPPIPIHTHTPNHPILPPFPPLLYRPQFLLSIASLPPPTHHYPSIPHHHPHTPPFPPSLSPPIPNLHCFPSPLPTLPIHPTITPTTPPFPSSQSPPIPPLHCFPHHPPHHPLPPPLYRPQFLLSILPPPTTPTPPPPPSPPSPPHPTPPPPSHRFESSVHAIRFPHRISIVHTK
ncbi:hypothetical protein C7M84_000549 [Penaeus vannamei]|uniref:Uncharacterized protein n=1 Tax=Penaeus vannamei TaxID=6689 RepID=A0A3R7PRZ0_PENVA|nr:hypothetical protein C7M84_000549 [Penaeus vannamei]